MPSQSRPPSQAGATAHRGTTATRPTRKIFNCIVDDSALVAGVKKSTRNGIRQWVKNGQIRLFVPLQALEELSRQKGGRNRHAEDVRETLTWLDEATTKHPHIVALQGGDETYEKWSEVEQFAVPRTLFSEYDDSHDVEPTDLPVQTTTKLDLLGGDEKPIVSSDTSDISRSVSPSSVRSVGSSASPGSPPTSPAKAAVSPVQEAASVDTAGSRPQSSSATVPRPLQPLLNYILWRVHQENDPVAALESFIFLCNDAYKVKFAKGFDIKTKRLEQLRDAIGREDREYRNRQSLLDRELVKTNNVDAPLSTENGDNEILLKPEPPRAPAAMLTTSPSAIIDPDAYGRSPSIMTQEPTAGPSQSPRAAHMHSRGSSSRGNHALPFNPRGSPRGHSRGNLRGAARGRGNIGVGRGGFPPNNSVNDASLDGEIDPDSFARPGPRDGFNGGRGNRKLWVPT